MRGAQAFRRILGVALLIGGISAIPTAAAQAAPHQTCQLGQGGQIKHVIILQFDNVHLERDNPNVPSDIQQIPALYDFLKHDGTLLSNDHTGLISHTADGITSTETGLYPGDEGLGVSNSFEYFSKYGTSNASAFTYWTDKTGTTASGDGAYTMINQAGNNTSAPWVPFTRAGCNFAGIGTANMELENDTTDLSDVFGASSPQYALGDWSYNPAYDAYNDQGSNIGATDFEGLAIHCSFAQSQPGGVCSPQNGGVADALPDEPSGYMGYNALFGALYVNPLLTGKADQPLPASVQDSFSTVSGWSSVPTENWWAPPVYDVFAPNANNSGPHQAPDPGNVDASTTPPPSTYVPGHTNSTEILDETGTPGFPGFNGMEANNALGYTAAAQEAGIPVTYTYLSDVHDDQYNTNGGDAYGPGEAGHEAQLREYNAAFAAFFHRLNEDGINQRNTLFVVTVDEGDHFVGGQPTNPGCNGVTVACQYGTPNTAGRNEGEVDVNLPGLLSTDYGISTKFGFDYDDAPAILVPNGTTGTGLPQDNSTVRQLEYDISQSSTNDPATGTTEPLTVNMADQTEEGILHMLNGDPKRDPTFTLFGEDDFYFQGSCDKGDTSTAPGCPEQNPEYAWNHGDIQPSIASTWQGWVGPGVQHLGENGAIWTDHTDVQPTLMELLGLHDDYTPDGAVLAQLLSPRSTPWTIRVSESAYDRVEAALKQVDAPFGDFGLDTLDADTNAVTSNPATNNDGFFTGMDSQLATCSSDRQALVGQIQTALDNASNGIAPISNSEEHYLVYQADALIDQAQALKNYTPATLPTHSVCS